MAQNLLFILAGGIIGALVATILFLLARRNRSGEPKDLVKEWGRLAGAAAEMRQELQISCEHLRDFSVCMDENVRALEQIQARADQFRHSMQDGLSEQLRATSRDII